MLPFLKKLFGSSADLKKLIDEGAIIIDVRSMQEFDAGHVPGSKNIALPVISSKIAEIKGMGRPIITVCASGSRSAVARSILSSNGIEAYNGGSWSSVRKLKAS